MSVRKDISGQVINKWRVLSYSHTKGKIAYYNCICLGCGKDFMVDGRNIRSERSKSCKTCADNNRKRGYYKNSKYSIEDAPYRYLMNRYKKGGRKRGYEFKLEFDQFKKLITSNCNYCNAKPNTTVNPLKNHKLAKDKIAQGTITYNGIDRVDSSKGYTVKNTVTCCETCNYAKHTMSLKQFKEWIKRVHKNLKNF